MEHGRKSCRQQNIPKRTMKSNEGALRPRMAAALLLVLFREIWGWDHNPKQLNSQQRGSHRRLGKAHGAREAPEAVSFRRARNAPWAALAGCIMPPNLLGHTMSGHSWGSHEVAYFVGKGETNGAIELSRLRGSERYAVCFDARQAAVAGVESSRDPFHEL